LLRNKARIEAKRSKKDVMDITSKIDRAIKIMKMTAEGRKTLMKCDRVLTDPEESQRYRRYELKAIQRYRDK
jgi:hypothetical protein